MILVCTFCMMDRGKMDVAKLEQNWIYRVSVDPNLLGQDCQIRAKTGIWQSPRSKNWIY